MIQKFLLPLAILTLTGCATSQMSRDIAAEPVNVRVIGLNDFHGNLDPPKQSAEAINAKGERVWLPSGGVAYLGSAIDSLRADAPNNVVVAAGDLIGASPLSSSLFLDEPSIIALNMIGLEFNALGNHEFDRGIAELKRIQSGGCEKHTLAVPCRIDNPFPGAKFKQLAANTITENGSTLFPGTALKSFGTGKSKVTIGFIGMTLKGTSNLVSAGRIAGIKFATEIDTANALVPKLKAAGADAIIVLIHEGLFTKTSHSDPQCTGVSGDLMPIVDGLDPAVDVVISGHTHWAYTCDYANINPARPVLVTSAGVRGQYVSAIDLKIDPVANKVVAKSARNVVVQSEAYTRARGTVAINTEFPVFSPRADLAELAKRYADAAKKEESRIIGTLAGPATRDNNAAGESVLGNLIADAQLAATKDPAMGGAQIAFMNPDGLRADVNPNPDGSVTFGSVFAAQPFSNQLVVKSFTGQQLRAVLEQQFINANWTRVLSPSEGFRFSYDMNLPVGQRILAMSLNGVPIRDDQKYRVAISDFLSTGGDLFSVFVSGTDAAIGPQDIDAMIAWLSRGGVTALPKLDRVENRTATQ